MIVDLLLHQTKIKYLYLGLRNNASAILTCHTCPNMTNLAIGGLSNEASRTGR